MNENLFPNLEQMLEPIYRERMARRSEDWKPAQGQSFRDYRLSHPARQTTPNQAIVVARIGELTEIQEAVVTATADFLARFFDLPVCETNDLDPGAFPPYGIRIHPKHGHPQLITDVLINEMMLRERPEHALIYLGVTA